MPYPNAYEDNNDWDPYNLGSFDWGPFFDESPVPNGPYWASPKGITPYGGAGTYNAEPTAYGPVDSYGGGLPAGQGMYGPDPYGPGPIGAYGGGPAAYGAAPYGYPPYPPGPGYGGYGGGNNFWIVLILLILIGSGYYCYKKGYFGLR